MEHRSCWCGNTELQPFSEDYAYCPTCGTLVRRQWPERSPAEKTEAYARYWAGDPEVRALIAREVQPILEERARSYLTERAPYWLNTLLQYRLPPARLLEVGSGPGAFVGLLQAAGFEATGLEVQAWAVDLTRRWFQVPMLEGTLESQDLPAHTFDGILLLDVLEHLVDPVTVLRHAVRLLRPDGLLLIQTPEFPEDQSFADLQNRQHPFLQMFIPEHRFLFSRRAIQNLLAAVGLPWVQFEPAIFAHYDMFFVAAARPLPRQDASAIQQALERTPTGRIVAALLELWRGQRECTSRLAEATWQVQEQRRQAATALEHLRKGAFAGLWRRSRSWQEAVVILERLAASGADDASAARS